MFKALKKLNIDTNIPSLFFVFEYVIIKYHFTDYIKSSVFPENNLETNGSYLLYFVNTS